MAEPIDETQQTYDVIAPEYARRSGAVYPELLEDVAFLRSRLPAGSRLADAGCGPGRDLAVLREQGFRAVGLDLSMAQLRSGGLDGVAQADMRQLPLRTSGLDGVWCQAALLHLPRMLVPAVLAEFARVVRTEGRLYLGVAEGDGEGWEIAANYGAERRRWFTFYREPELTALLAAAGFEVESVRRNQAHRDWLRLQASRVRAARVGS